MQRSQWQHFLDGVSSLFAFSPTPIRLPEETDEEAIASDWEAVMGDLENARRKVLESDK